MVVGIIANPMRESAFLSAGELSAWLRGRGVGTLLHAELATALGQEGLSASPDGFEGVDFVLALGGDGTLLAANRLSAPYGIPILGVHMGGPGSFGFLTETSPDACRSAVERVLRGEYRVEERLMVRAQVMREGRTLSASDGLNEIVLRAQQRMLKMRVTVGGTYITTYAADGIIVATPTGSTAYNLAAGGPLVHPSVEAILLTPICPHTLNVRSLLTGVRDVIDVQVESSLRDTLLLTVDGQVSEPVETEDCIRFSQSPVKGRFISLDGPNFYGRVQARLRLGERF